MGSETYTVRKIRTEEDKVKIYCIGEEILVQGTKIKEGIKDGTIPKWGDYGIYYYDGDYTRWISYNDLPVDIYVPDYLHNLSVHGESGKYTVIAILE